MSCLIGIDVESISDIKAAVLKHERFIDRILTAKEKKQLQSRKGDAYYAYIAGRYSAKEAYAKATGYGISKHAFFTDIQIIDNQFGAPEISVFGKSMVKNAKNYRVSISHKIKLDLVATEVLIEVNDGNSNS